MSGELDRIQEEISKIAEGETSVDALRIIDRLTRAMDSLRTELLYERLEEPVIPTDAELKAFKEKVYNALKSQRATDLVIVYNRSNFEGMSAITRLCMVQALITVANEQKIAVPALWQFLLDSRGHF